MKSEPDAFSIWDLKKRGVAEWDGVRNYAARNNLRAMRKGDQALFYHSSTTPSAVVGRMTIHREAYPDPSQFDPKSEYYDSGSKPDAPRWDQVDVKFLEEFPTMVTLDEIRGLPPLKNMVLVKRGRLSVQPVTPEEWAFILRRAGSR